MLKFLPYAFTICLLSAIGASTPVEADKSASVVDSLLAMAYDETLDYKKRVNILKRALRDDKTGKAMHALAKLYIGKGTVSSRYDASLWLQRAIRKDRNNADFLHSYADLLWTIGRRGTARKYAKRAIEKDPNNAGALYLAGRYAAWQMTRYLDAEWVDYNYGDYGVTEKSFSLERFAEPERKESEAYLSRALAADPEHRPARILLGLVYYESGMPNELIDLFRDQLKDESRDSEAFFAVGLGYQAKEDLETAYRAYVSGLARMTEEEQLFMKSVFLLANRKAIKEDEALPSEEALRRFWTGRDPLHLTPVNERLMEHCGRVAYANLRFGEPVKGIPGWATDKGEAYIRYGRPVSRRVTPAEIDTHLDKPIWYQNYLHEIARISTAPVRHKPRAEQWDYPGFSLIFLNTDTRDHWKFGLAWMDGYPLGYSSLVARISDYYKDPYGWERYDAPFQIAQFRGSDGKSRVEIYYALPGEEVRHKFDATGVHSVDLKQGLFLFDTAWDTVRKEVGRLEKMPWVVYNAMREGYLFASERLMVEPGDYHFAAEVEDSETKTIGTFRYNLPVRRFGRDSLQVSSLLLARRVLERDDRPFGREAFMVLPNPIGRCERFGQASFYFEIYNLARDEFGATHYQTEYQVRALEEGAENPDPDWTTTVSYSREGTRDWEPSYLTLDMDGSMPGYREFRVVVTDLQTGQVDTSATHFRVMW